MTPLRRLAAGRPHVLVLPAPGRVRTRIAVEAGVAARGGVLAASPADADVLVVTGSPGPRLAAVADAVWRGVPAPRARVRVRAPGDVDRALDAALGELAGRARDGRGPARGERGATGDATDDGPDAGARDPEPGMADLAADDRDGLALDALHVPLGPVLPGWPAGLVVHAVLAGDLVTAARAEVLDVPDGAPGHDDGLAPDVARLDVLARVLDLAGAARAARRARALRDADTTAADRAAAGRRLARSPLLRWALRDLPLPATVADGDTDVAARLRRLAGELGSGAAPVARPTATVAVDALVGLDLGAARIVLAALDPDTTRGADPDPATGPTPVPAAAAPPGVTRG